MATPVQGDVLDLCHEPDNPPRAIAHIYRQFPDGSETEFIFRGLRKQDAAAIKSLEGADIVWVEEAQNVSEASWKNLIPTVRKDGSEIWVSFNPDNEDASTYHRFVTNPPPDTLSVLVNCFDNPWKSKVLRAERERMKRTDLSACENIWLVKRKKFTEGAYFRVQIEALEKGSCR